MDSFIASLVSGHLFSKGVDTAQNRFQHYLQGKDISIILDEYDKTFMYHHEADISLSNCDMGAVFEKRKILITYAKDCLKKDNSVIKNNLKQEFIDIACREIGDDSAVVQNYLNNFYILVLAKETKEVSVGVRALLNLYADSQYEINKITYEELERLKRAVEKIGGDRTESVDFKSYYQNVIQRFSAEKQGPYRNLVGSASDERSYIDAYIKVESKRVPALSFLNDWFNDADYGTILISGEPGHGKSLLCDKAVIEFCKGKFLQGKAQNVLAISLNTGQNRKIIIDGEVELENALVWKAKRKQKFTFQDCQGSLLFMDGFDEFIDEAKRTDTNIKNIYDFMESVNDIAFINRIHIVVLSRTIAVAYDLDSLSGSYQHYKLLPISEEQQNRWLDEHKEYNDYKEDFYAFRKQKNLNDLLGVPLLFRLIVHNRFKTISSNTVELYDNLFTNLLKNRHITDDEEIQLIEQGLMKLAYKVYCTDTTTAYYLRKDLADKWVFSFYICAYNGKTIGFFHRTFYQYFLAKYIYVELVKLTDENAKSFIGLLAERELDATVRQYLPLMLNNGDEVTVHANIEKMIVALIKTEAYVALKPRVESGDADNSKILRSQNIFRNVFHIAAAFAHVIQIPFKGNLDILVRKFRSEGIILICGRNKSADLKEACLAGAYLKRAHLTKADLTKADLRGADLRNVHLYKSIMSESNLIEANLKGANMREANLGGADLRGACMNNAHLSEAVLTKANLRDANLRRANLKQADLSEASLEKAYLTFAYLLKANLRNAYMREADLRGADLRGACLAGANLRGADLNKADLSGADLVGSIFNITELTNSNLSSASVDIRYKEIIDPTTKGYGSINWVKV